MARWKSAIERFWDAVHVEPNTGCWLWAGGVSRMRHGYGRFDVDGRATVAHRFSYETFVGSVPDGMDLDHACDQKLCVNPEHLRPMSHRDNVLRGTGPAAQHHRKTHCLRGHELSGPNLAVYKSTRKSGRPRVERRCRACASVRQNERRVASW